jgi:uncharacterized protein (TIGR02594 family)
MLPTEFAWLRKEAGPKVLLAAIADLGVREIPGAPSNPVILGWAKELGIQGYTNDGTPWCALAVSHWVHQAGYQPAKKPLWALDYATWGNPADKPSLGDILVFKRKTATGVAGHVGLYVGETSTHFHVLGGNQDDQVCISPVAKGKLVAARRSPFKVAQPANVRPIRLAAGASLETSQA